MATLSALNPTLADVAKRMDPNGKIDTIVEILNETNPILEDMSFIEANETTSHKTTVRSGLPSATWRKLYGGVQPSKSRTVQVRDSIGMLESYAEVDKALADLNGNTSEFRLSEDRAFIEAMNQEMASTLFYGDETDAPEEFTGLSARFNDLSAENADNILSAGGSGSDNTSIWLVVWGPNTVHGLYPKGSKAGLSVSDKGQVTIEDVDGNGGRMEAYRSHYRWDCGVTVRDWRYVVRIPNIDVSDLNGLTGTQAITAATSVLKLMVKATERIQQMGMGRATFYCNRTVREMLRLAIIDKVSSNLTFETVAGKSVMTFDGVPVRRCDALLNTEAVVA